MQNIKKIKFIVSIFFVVLLTLPIFFMFPKNILAVNDVSIDNEIDFDLKIAGTDDPITVTASSGGKVTALDLGGDFDYLDMTLDNSSIITFTIPTGNYLKITQQLGSTNYLTVPTCPTNTATIKGTGLQTVLRLEITKTPNCHSGSVGSHSSGGGGGTPLAEESTDCKSGQLYSTQTGKLCPNVVIPTTPSVAPTVPAVVPAKTCELYMTKYIKYKSMNDLAEVKKLQQFLQKYEGFTTLAVDGRYGPLSVAAVKKFQTKYAKDILAPWGFTKPTGYVFKTTIKKINSLYCEYTLKSQ